LESGDSDQALIVDALKEIARQGERAGEIVRRLRQFVRKGEVQQQPTDINKLVLAVLDLLPHELRDRNIEIRLALDNDLPAVAADRIQIEQVLLNLLRNAIDAMPANQSGDQAITIRTSAGDGETIEVAVSDTGRGLVEDSLEQVFDTFFSTKDNGMGMGLSISRSIIQAHGGRIWVTQNPGSGVTFRFTLPKRQIETHAA
jgi:signal transduction histidine kinase